MPVFDLATLARIVGKGAIILLLITAFATATIAFAAGLDSILGDIAEDVPALQWFEFGIDLLPANYGVCLGALVSAYISRYFYVASMKALQYLRDI